MSPIVFTTSIIVLSLSTLVLLPIEHFIKIGFRIVLQFNVGSEMKLGCFSLSDLLFQATIAFNENSIAIFLAQFHKKDLIDKRQSILKSFDIKREMIQKILQN